LQIGGHCRLYSKTMSLRRKQFPSFTPELGSNTHPISYLAT
jgi:hypothetical protein